MRIDAQVVVALSVERRAEALQLGLLLCDQAGIERSCVARVEADLGAELEQRLDDARPQPVVVVGRGAVLHDAVSREQEEDRRRASRRSMSTMRSKEKFGSVPRARWTGAPASPRASRQAARRSARARLPSAGRRPDERPSASSARECPRRGSARRRSGLRPSAAAPRRAGGADARAAGRVGRGTSRRPGSGRARRAARSAPRSLPGGRTPPRGRCPAADVRRRRPARLSPNREDRRCPGAPPRACRAPSWPAVR